MLVVGDIFLEESELELYKDLYLSPQIKLFKKYILIHCMSQIMG